MSETMLDNPRAKRGQAASNRQATGKHGLAELECPSREHPKEVWARVAPFCRVIAMAASLGAAWVTEKANYKIEFFTAIPWSKAVAGRICQA